MNILVLLSEVPIQVAQNHWVKALQTKEITRSNGVKQGICREKLRGREREKQGGKRGKNKKEEREKVRRERGVEIGREKEGKIRREKKRAHDELNVNEKWKSTSGTNSKNKYGSKQLRWYFRIDYRHLKVSNSLFTQRQRLKCVNYIQK